MKRWGWWLLAALALTQAASAGLITIAGGRGVAEPEPPAGDSDLAQFAAAMSANSWAEFTMGNFTDATLVAVSSGGNLTLTTFAARGWWDPVNKRLQFAGTAHTGGTNIAGSGGLATWDDATNQWSRETYTWNSENPGHTYYHLTGNPTSGDLYFRSYNSTNIYTREFGNTGQGSWDDTVVANISGDYGNQVSGCLEWFPDLNSGSGGLVFVDVLGANWSNAALSSWSTQSGDAQTGNLDNVCAYAGGFVYFGGGSGSLDMYRLSSTGTVAVRADFPQSAGANDVAGAGLLVAHPNGTDLLLIEQDASVGDVFRYNATANTWADVSNVPAFNADVFMICTPIHEYDVVLCFRHNTGETPEAWVYKP